MPIFVLALIDSSLLVVALFAKVTLVPAHEDWMNVIEIVYVHARIGQQR
jgi:hypothetical protein